MSVIFELKKKNKGKLEELKERLSKTSGLVTGRILIFLINEIFMRSQVLKYMLPIIIF